MCGQCSSGTKPLATKGHATNVLRTEFSSLAYSIDNNRHCCYTALKSSSPANQGKHQGNRILYSSVRKRLCPSLPCWKLAGKISYRPFYKASAFFWCNFLPVIFAFCIAVYINRVYHSCAAGNLWKIRFFAYYGS